MSISPLLLAGLLGLGLSASCGLNTFLPLLLLSAAARWHIAGIALNAKFAWLSSDIAILILLIATLIEVIADKVPAIDHFLDVVGTFIRPIAGLVAMASVFHGVDPTTAAIVGLIVGTPVSLGMHTVKAATRAASSATTFGCANPVLSLIEDLISLIVSMIAIFAPLLVPLVVLIVAVVLWKLAKRINAPPAPSPGSGS